MKHIRNRWLLVWSVSMGLVACNNEPSSINIALEPDYRGILETISQSTQPLAEKLALIEAAQRNGLADNQKAIEMIRQAVASMGGTLEEKLDAILAAVKSQTTDLETKLALVDAAVTSGFADSSAAQGLLLEAIDSLGGTLEEKLTAIENAIGDTSTALSSKLAIIETALVNGFADEKKALSMVQTALDTLKGQLANMDDGLSNAIDDVSAAFGSLSSEVDKDLANSLSYILSSIQGLPDDSIIAAIQQALVELKEALIFRLKYVGEPRLTTSNGGAWHAVIQVEPAKTAIDESMLKLDILSKKQFFPTWKDTTPGSASSDSYSLSLEADPSVQGQYTVTISCQSPDVTWNEYAAALSAAYGSPGNPKKVSTEPFNLVMMPKALDGLKYWTYPAASFTFKRHGSINNIYYSLDSGVFETQDESETRSYTADFLESMKVLPQNDSVAPVFLQLDKEKKMAVFIPDTAGITYTQYWPDKDPSDRGGWRLWRNFKDSSGVKHESILGKLVLTDRWNVKDTIHNFKIGWYNAVWFPESAIVKANDIQEDNTAVVDIRALLSKLGLERAWLEGRFILQEQYGDLEGPYFKMSAQLLPETLKLAVRFQADPIVESMFGLTAHYDLWIFPTETDPQFKILALSFSYSLVVTIVEE